ncbi:MAG: hypothetical protein HC895_16325 [Leptolyngbyaceae cyanobacterium SM1_3_5]|nr:hypothetical protein [Leptolyngbyaceae cyanobacterium SM1_3_5]
MSYQDLLNPWTIDRLLPNAQRRRVAEFRKRNDAEEYFKIVQRLMPDARFEIVCETGQEQSEMPVCVAVCIDSVPISIKICEGTESRNA